MRAARRFEGDPASSTASVLARLHSSLSALTESEQKVAAAVRQDPHAAVYASVTELAAAAGVGETTVLRFARKLGYRSYQDFKMDLARDIFSAGSGHPAVPVASEGAGHDLLQRATEENRRVIVDTSSMLDRQALAQAVEILSKARQIHFYGAGHSGITAQDARHRFWRLGFSAHAFDDSHFQLMAAATLSTEDAAVGLSVSGSSRDVVECLEMARNRGAKTIAITGYQRSPITRVADVVLLTVTREMPLESGSFTSKIGQLHVLDILLRYLAESRAELVRRRQEETGRAISGRFY